MKGSPALKNSGHARLINIEPDERQKTLVKYIWIYPAFVAAVFFLSSLFMDSFKIRLVSALFLGFFPWKETVYKIYNSAYEQMRTQLLVLLQVLCTGVSSGYSIEKSLTLVRPVIEHTFGKRSPLIKPLIKMENKLKMHIDSERVLSEFASDLNFPETIPVFHALSISGRIGSSTLAILRSSCQMLSEMNAVHNDINAENAGKNAEAVMLCIMPFAITFALNQMSSNYLAEAKASGAGKILMAAAFVLCIIAAALLFRFMTHPENSPAKNPDTDSSPGKKTPLADMLTSILPTSFIARRHTMFNELSYNPRISYEKYIRKQIITTLAAGVLVFTITGAIGKPQILSVPAMILIYVLNINDIRTRVNLKHEDLMRDIPLFLCLMSTLLEAGLQLPKAIEICSKAFDEHGTISYEINAMRAGILSGLSASEAVENFSIRTQIPEAKAALLLVARYGRLGTAEVLNLLSLQASACWNLCRNAARKKQERESLGMLLPMTLDFICVLIVAVTPAIISMAI
ncbi:MAG: type II secretion system F family protein [Clostridiales bacterium]|nr:type II secretion system F family protein [Clostridiales bacterium]